MQQTPVLTCWYFSYWSGVRNDGFEMYVRPRRVIFSFSTNDNLFAVFVGWPVEEFHTVRSDIDGEFMKVLDLAPEFADRVRAGRWGSRQDRIP